MKGRLVRCAIVLAAIAIPWGLDFIIRTSWETLSTDFQFWHRIWLCAFTCGGCSGALAGLFFPKKMRRLTAVDTDQRVILWLALLVAYFCSCALHGPVVLLAFPYLFHATGRYVLGSDSDSDDERLFAGASDAVRRAVEKMRTVHLPTQPLPVPA